MDTKVVEDRRIVTPMPEDMANEFERLCQERGQSMAGVIKMLVWDWIQEQKKNEVA